MHTVAARLRCQSAMIGWANSCPSCMDRLRKCYYHLVGGSFLAGKAAWALSGCLTTESADCHEVGSGLGFILESELGQKWRYGALKACIG